MNDNTQVFEDAPEDRKRTRAPKPVIITRKVPLGFSPQGKVTQIIIAK